MLERELCKVDENRDRAHATVQCVQETRLQSDFQFHSCSASLVGSMTSLYFHCASWRSFVSPIWIGKNRNITSVTMNMCSTTVSALVADDLWREITNPLLSWGETTWKNKCSAFSASSFRLSDRSRSHVWRGKKKMNRVKIENIGEELKSIFNSWNVQFESSPP